MDRWVSGSNHLTVEVIQFESENFKINQTAFGPTLVRIQPCPQRYSMSEKDKFVAWLTHEVNTSGLIDMHVEFNSKYLSEEELFLSLNEANEMLENGKEVERKDVF